MRVVRTVIGVLVLLVALPLLLVGGVLWTALSHRDASGAFAATIDPVRTDGYAVVVADIDALLRRDAAFARGGQTTVRLTARGAAGPAFVGLAPAGSVAEYLSGVAHAEVTEVRVTRGRLPVRATFVPGTQAPRRSPADETFWVTTSVAPGTIEWTPSAVRHQHLALVVMNPDGQAPVAVSLQASVTAGWLASTTWGVLVLGAVLLALSLAVLCWPTRPREVVYVVTATGAPRALPPGTITGPAAPITALAAPITASPLALPAAPLPPVASPPPAAPPLPAAPPPPAAHPRWRIPPPAVPTLDWPPRTPAEPSRPVDQPEKNPTPPR